MEHLQFSNGVLVLVAVIEALVGVILWVLWSKICAIETTCGMKFDNFSGQLGHIRESYVKRDELSKDIGEIKGLLREISEYTHKSVHRHNNKLQRLVTSMALVRMKLGLPAMRPDDDDEDER